MKIRKAILIIAVCLAVVAGIVVFGPFSGPKGAKDGQTPEAPENAKGAAETPGLATDTLEYDTHSGLVSDTNHALVVANCTACHSTELIQQNRFTRDGWQAKIRWMQKEHNLWDLGESEKFVLDYLEKYYSPSSMDERARLRRAPLEDIQWYEHF